MNFCCRRLNFFSIYIIFVHGAALRDNTVSAFTWNQVVQRLDFWRYWPIEVHRSFLLIKFLTIVLYYLILISKNFGN